ncbi:MAG: two-component response regulator [Cyanobacteria bacterium RYN_339]|nr:two-component response regulator [Cyanobacteria bacterium RYN_339]
MRVLVVEDERDLASAIQEGLERQGFAVDVAFDGEEGWRLTQVFPYEAIVLDRMLPVTDGIALCRRLRQSGSGIGVLMLTALDAVDDRVEGLNAGADDYLVKPFEFKELLARLRALTRRHAPIRLNRLQVRELVVDLDGGTVEWAGNPMSLSRKEYMLLVYFMRHPGQLVTPEQIIESAWDAESDASADVVRTHLKNLRKKIEAAGGPPLIRTVHGMGYRLES